MIEKNIYFPDDFHLEGGGVLHGINIRYHVSCEEVCSRKVIWICHALTANSNPSEWWSSLVGVGKLFDSERYYIVCANIIGSCYGTTGPADVSTDFPVVSVRDLAKAHELLRQYLDIKRIDLLIGGSNGGFQAIEWAISNSSAIGNLCLLATNAVVSPWCVAFNESQRLAIRADNTFKWQKSNVGGEAGLAAARSIALLSYRSYNGYCSTQKEDENFFMASKASSYQEYQGAKLVNRFNAYSYYCLSLCCDTHNVGRNRGGVVNALKSITAKTLCIAIDSDMLFPVEEMDFIKNNVADCALEIIHSDFGHDGFLLESESITRAVKKHFAFLV